MQETTFAERDLKYAVVWYCIVFGVAQGVYQLGWGVAIASMLFSPDPGISTSYILSSFIGFYTALMSWQIARHAVQPGLQLLALLVPCLGLAFVAESVYITSRYYDALGMQAILHFTRNVTLDLWLPFAATLLLTPSTTTRLRLIKFGIGWWMAILFLFHWWTGAPPTAPLLALAILAVSVAVLVSFVRRGSPSLALLLLGATLWGLLLVHFVFSAVNPIFPDIIATPTYALSHFPTRLHWLLGMLNEWLYNSTPFWLIVALYWRDLLDEAKRLFNAGRLLFKV